MWHWAVHAQGRHAALHCPKPSGIAQHARSGEEGAGILGVLSTRNGVSGFLPFSYAIPSPFSNRRDGFVSGNQAG